MNKKLLILLTLFLGLIQLNAHSQFSKLPLPVGSGSEVTPGNLYHPNKFGIGTNSVLAQLDVVRSETMGLKLDPTKATMRIGYGSEGSSQMLFDSNEIHSSSTLFLGSSPSSSTIFGNISASGWEQLMEIEPNGNVGIGTSSPDYLLDVAGDANVASMKTNYLVTGIGNANYDFIRLGTPDVPYFAGLMLNKTTNSWGDPGDFVIFTYDNRNMNFKTGSGDVIFFPDESSGKVGIGTSTPSGKLDVTGGQLVVINGAAGANFSSSRVAAFRGSDLSGNAWLEIQSDDNKVSGLLFGTPSTEWQGSIRWSQSGSALEFHAARQKSMIIKSDGNVGIGTSSPDEKLTVNGKILAEEIIVISSVPAPDYVFEPDYNLMSLNELQTYIQNHKHLPEIPSAKEIAKQGVKSGEMDMLLLKKVEELTLYTLEQQKMLDKQKEMINKQEQIIEQQQKQIEAILTKIE